MGLMSGFMGGVGKGLVAGSEMAYKEHMTEQRDDKMFERQVQREDIAAARQDVRDETNHKRTLERDRSQLQNRLEEVKQAAIITNKLQQEFGAEALAEIQQVRERLGPKASDAQVRAALSNPNAIKAFEAQTAFVNGQATFADNLATNRVQRDASAASAANSRDSIAGRQQDRKTAEQTRADEAMARNLLADLGRAKQQGNTAAEETLRTEYIRLTGKDPLASKTKGNYSVVKTKSDLGGETPTGLLNQDTGEVTPYTVSGGTQSSGGTPPVPGAQQAKDGNWYVKQNGKYFKVDAK